MNNKQLKSSHFLLKFFILSSPILENENILKFQNQFVLSAKNTFPDLVADNPLTIFSCKCPYHIVFRSNSQRAKAGQQYANNLYYECHSPQKIIHSFFIFKLLSEMNGENFMNFSFFPPQGFPFLNLILFFFSETPESSFSPLIYPYPVFFLIIYLFIYLHASPCVFSLFSL